MLDTTLSIHGKSIRYVLHDDKLTIDTRIIALADIARVRLATLAEIQMCELGLRDGTTATITNDTKDKRASYGTLIRELHARLAPLPGITYVRGAWLLVGLMAAIGVLAIVFALALYLGWFTPPPMFAGKAMLIMILGVVWVFVGPLLVWRSRPRSYDARDLPKDLVQ